MRPKGGAHDPPATTEARAPAEDLPELLGELWRTRVLAEGIVEFTTAVVPTSDLPDKGDLPLIDREAVAQLIQRALALSQTLEDLPPPLRSRQRAEDPHQLWWRDEAAPNILHYPKLH